MTHFAVAQLCAGLVRTYNHKLNYLNSRQCQTLHEYQFVNWIFSKLLKKNTAMDLLWHCQVTGQDLMFRYAISLRKGTSTWRWHKRKKQNTKAKPKQNTTKASCTLSFKIALCWLSELWEHTQDQRHSPSLQPESVCVRDLYVLRTCIQQGYWIKQEYNRGFVRQVNWNAAHCLTGKVLFPLASFMVLCKSLKQQRKKSLKRLCKIPADAQCHHVRQGRLMTRGCSHPAVLRDLLISATFSHCLQGWHWHSQSCTRDYISSSAYHPMNNYTSLAFMCCYNFPLYSRQHQCFVRNPLHLYSGKCYEHKTLLGATSYDVKSNRAWNFPLITIGSFLSIEALVLISVHFIFQLH